MEDTTADITTPEQTPHSCQRQNDPPPHTMVPEAASPAGQANATNDPPAATAAAPQLTPVCDDAASPFLAAGPQPGTPEQNPSSPTVKCR